jgi:hypothetical protein
MSDTPETDTEDYRICEAWSSTANDYYTMLEFARKLERERDEARSDLAYRLEQYAIKQLQLSDARKTILELQKK